MNSYDLIIIGGGPAGYLAAERAAKADMSVLLFEKDNLGGVCLNEGCVPSKALLQCAKVFDFAKDGSEFGVSVSKAQIDQTFVIRRKGRIVKKLVVGVKGKLKRAGVIVINSKAKILGKRGDLFEVSAEEDIHKSKYLLIATGSSPIIPPIEGLTDALNSGKVVTNREILSLNEIPKSLIVIGGGVVGLEMASYYNSVGSEVTVIEMMDQIGGSIDSEISKLLQENYEKKGVNFLLGSKVISISDSTVKYIFDNKEGEISSDIILLSAGRKPLTEDLELENIGVKTEQGGIVTDQYSRTSVENVYAAGDVNGKSLLAHTAYREGEVAVNQILGKPDKIKYNTIPAIIYTNPEVASIGETEQTAKEKGIDYKVAKLPMTYSGRYMAEDERGNGICKLILDAKNNTLIGAHMIGLYVSEIIYGASVLIDNETPLEDMKKIIFPHPSVSEIIKETLFEF